MRTIADDLAAAQAENSPSIAAAVKAAIDKEGPQPAEQVDALPAEEAAPGLSSLEGAEVQTVGAGEGA